MRWIVVFVIYLLASASMAQTVEPPEFPKVSRALAADSGNEVEILSNSDPEADRIGTLPARTYVEVTGATEDGAWSRINFEGQTGWVASVSLEDIKFRRMKPSGLPGLLLCHGTEPFWSLELTEKTSQLNSPEAEGPKNKLAWQDHAYFDSSKALLETVRYLGLVSYETCSDGMSDHSFGLAITLFIKGEVGSIGGCCSINLN